MASASQLYQLPIHARPRRTWGQILNATLFLLLFLPGCGTIHAFQVVILLPLKLVPCLWSRKLYEEGMRYSKGSFAILLNLMNQLCAPTSLSITFEMQGQGKFTHEEVEQIVERDATGRVVALNLPSKSVIISNHQVYCDWWYVWCLTYFSRAHKDVFIVLKQSLRWLPILGPAMQIYRFIFLARSWASDKLQLSIKLSKLGKRAEDNDKPFALILFPEGTLVSKDTRPISRKFAEKLGIRDLDNLLLPHSTGLQWCLRSLAPRVSTLRLIDITITYPGVPPKGYGQSYYTLGSVFCDRTPPPVVHMHLRMFDVTKDVPIGGTARCGTKTTMNEPVVLSNTEVDIQEQERERFDCWLRSLWVAKDKFMTGFLGDKASVLGMQKPIEIPLELRDLKETADAYCFLMPVIVIYGWTRMLRKFF